MPVALICQTVCTNGCYQTNALAFAFCYMISSGVLLRRCSYELPRLSFPLFPRWLIHRILCISLESKLFQKWFQFVVFLPWYSFLWPAHPWHTGCLCALWLTGRVSFHVTHERVLLYHHTCKNHSLVCFFRRPWGKVGGADAWFPLLCAVTVMTPEQPGRCIPSSSAHESSVTGDLWNDAQGCSLLVQVLV